MCTIIYCTHFPGITSPDGKRSMMKLSQRMVNNFCSIINLPNSQQWTALFGTDELEVRASIHKFTNPGQSHGMVLSATTTIWLPVPSQIVFSFFKDERTRAQVQWLTILIHYPLSIF